MHTDIICGCALEGAQQAGAATVLLVCTHTTLQRSRQPHTQKTRQDRARPYNAKSDKATSKGHKNLNLPQNGQPVARLECTLVRAPHAPQPGCPQVAQQVTAGARTPLHIARHTHTKVQGGGDGERLACKKYVKSWNLAHASLQGCVRVPWVVVRLNWLGARLHRMQASMGWGVQPQVMHELR